MIKMDKYQNRDIVSRQVKINEEGNELMLQTFFLQVEFAEAVLIEISWKLGKKDFDFDDVIELNLIMLDYIKNNRSEFVTNEIAMGRAIGYESGTVLHMEYIEKVRNGVWEFGKDTFWVVANIFECEVVVFYESGGKFVYGKGRANNHFGRLEFLINLKGNIEIIVHKEVILEAENIIDDVRISIDDSDEKGRSGEKDGMESEMTKKMEARDIMKSIKTKSNKKNMKTGLKGYIIQGLEQERDKGEMGDQNFCLALQQVEQFFDNYRQMEGLSFLTKKESSNECWKTICRLAERLNRDIIFI